MKIHFLQIFGVILACLIWLCGASDVKAYPIQQSGINSPSTQSQTGQTQNSSQNRSNRFAESQNPQKEPSNKRIDELKRKTSSGGSGKTQKSGKASKKNRSAKKQKHHPVRIKSPRQRKNKEVEKKLR